MTLTYRSTAGRRLTVTEGDGNIAHLANASGIDFLQSGTGAIDGTVQGALRLFVHTSQYSTEGHYDTARNALTGTIGMRSLDIATTLRVLGAGPHSIGGTTDANRQILITGSFTGTTGLTNSATITQSTPTNNTGVTLSGGTIVQSGSAGSTAVLVGMWVDDLQITSGTATAVDAASLYVANIPAGGTVTGRRMPMWVAGSGGSTIDSDGTAVELFLNRTAVGNSVQLAFQRSGVNKAALGISASDDLIFTDASLVTRMTLSGQNLGLGTATFGTNAASVFSIFSGTAPTTGPADSVQFYSSDDSAGNTIPSFFCEGTGVIATGQADSASSVRVKMRINGTVVTLLAI